MVRFVPRRQPVERSCCMSPPTTVLIRRMEPAMRPTSGSVSPARAITVTPTTKAEEMGLESEMPTLMPFTSTKTEASSTPSTA